MSAITGSFDPRLRAGGDAMIGSHVYSSRWKARAVMMKGLSCWADYGAGTECLTPLGLAVRAILMEQS